MLFSVAGWDYVLPVLLPVVAVAVFFICLSFFVRIAREQIKLHNSITLVPLRYSKMFFIIAAVLSAVLMIYTLILTVAPSEDRLGYLLAVYDGSTIMPRIIFASLTALLFSVFMLTTLMIFARAGLVDRGIYVGYRFIDWHHIYDYYVDEKHCAIILSINKLGPLTLAGTVMPLRYSRADAEKIKFIMNKNKNKFIPRYELR